jgi:uncharacterized protein
MNLLNVALNQLVQRPRLAVGLLLAIALPLSIFAPAALQPDNSLRAWFLESDPLVSSYEQFKERFGNDEIVMVQIDWHAPIFDTDRIRLLTELSEKIDGVDGVLQVHSLLNAQDAWESPDGINFDKLLPDPNPDAETLREAAERAQENPMIRGKFINEEGNQTMFWVELQVTDEFDDQRGEIVHAIRDVCDQADSPDARLAGLSVIYTGLNDATQSELPKFFAVAYALIFFVLWWVFRRWQLIVATYGVIAIACMIAVGLYGAMGFQMNLMTVMLPTLIMILGITDAVHFPTAFLHHRKDHPEEDRSSAAYASLKSVALPCFLTTITTAGGFASLGLSPMAVLRDYGLFTALGLLVALLASFAIMSIAFTSGRMFQLPNHRLLDRFVEGCTQIVLQRSRWIWISTIIATLIAVIGATRVNVDTFTLGYLPKTSRTVTDHNQIESSWGSYSTMESLLIPNEGFSLESPEVLNAIESFLADAKNIPEVDDTYSFAMLYRRMLHVLTGDEEPPMDPFSEELIAQLNIFLEAEDFSWFPEEPEYQDNFLRTFVTEDRDLGRVTFVGKLLTAAEGRDLLAKIQTLADKHFEGVATFKPAGYAPLYANIIDYVIDSQITSFFSVVAFLLVVIGLWTRSLRITLLAMIPNLLPVLTILGAMGWFGITLDIGTAVVGAIVIGVSIDDTIHFISHWNHNEKHLPNWEACVRQTLREAGKPIFITSLMLSLGFSVMMLAELRSAFYFGFLTTLAAMTALAADLFLFPLLLKRSDR